MILCCGEALIDMIAEPTMGEKTKFVSHSGGAILNTAIALGRLNTKVGLLAGLSSDMFGQQLLKTLKTSYVDTTRIITSDRPTTLAFVTLQNGQATYSFFDENSAGRMLTPNDMPNQLAGVSTLFIGGISLACEPCADAFVSLIDCHAPNCVVMLDPNIRPAFITNEARYRDRLNHLISLANIIKASDEDLNWLFSGHEHHTKKISHLLRQGTSIVVITRGDQGATGYLGDGSVIPVGAEPIEMVDTVGAGDTFNAGLLAQLNAAGHLTKDGLHTLPAHALSKALTFASSAAATTVSRSGANPPWFHELDSTKSKIINC